MIRWRDGGHVRRLPVGAEHEQEWTPEARILVVLTALVLGLAALVYAAIAVGSHT